MNKVTPLATLVAIIIGMSSYAQANGEDDDDDNVINATLTNRTDTDLSGSGHTILENCGASTGNQFATVKVEQEGGTSKVKFKIRDAVANTVFSVWLRIKGGTGHNSAGSPLTGGGATPLASGTALDGLNDYSPWGIHPAGSMNPTNGFTTDDNGNANWTAYLDFPIFRGAYPFHKTTVSRPGWENVPNVSMAIANPADGTGGPFLFRVISHCTDNYGHGLSPGVREAWFQYP